MKPTALDRTQGYTALLSMDPGFARLETRESEFYVTALLNAWYAQDEITQMWEFARKHLRTRTRCATIGCSGQAVMTVVWSMPGSRDEETTDYCCRSCADRYERRAALKARISKGGRPWARLESTA